MVTLGGYIDSAASPVLPSGLESEMDATDTQPHIQSEQNLLKHFNMLMEFERSKNLALAWELNASRSSVISLTRELESFKGLFKTTVDDLTSTINDFKLKVDLALKMQQTTTAVQPVATKPDELSAGLTQLCRLITKGALGEIKPNERSRHNPQSKATPLRAKPQAAVEGAYQQATKDTKKEAAKSPCRRRNAVETTRQRAVRLLGHDALQAERFRLNEAWVFNNRKSPDKFALIPMNRLDGLLEDLDIGSVTCIVNEAAKRIFDNDQYSNWYGQLISQLISLYPVSHEWLSHRYNSFFKAPAAPSPFDELGFTWDYMNDVIARIPTDITVSIVNNDKEPQLLKISSEMSCWELNVLAGKLIEGRVSHSTLRGFGSMRPREKLSMVGVKDGSVIETTVVYDLRYGIR